MGSLDIDSRSDIYSLGVVLYELLTGSTPLERAKVRQAAYMEILRRIRDDETPKPSTRLSESKDTLATISAQRKTEPARLARLVRGELDWIVMRALEKDRVRRYDTANALARDIQRYLGGDPVEAGPPSATYRLRKVARKHRAWLLTATAFAAILASATALLTWQAFRVSRSERLLALAQRNRALEAEEVAKEQTDRALRAEQLARAELERVSQVRRLEDATVYLKNKVAGNVVATGIGFVVEVEGDAAVVVTARSVACPISPRHPFGLPYDSATVSTARAPLSDPGRDIRVEIEAVFRSGQGPKREQALSAEIVAADSSDEFSTDLASDEFSTDLAILVVKGVKRPPVPINIQINSESVEGLAYLGAGFSLGRFMRGGMGGAGMAGGVRIDDNQENPSVAISRGDIVTSRRDEYGLADVFYVDRSLYPNDSGGPIVEEGTGKLIGVAMGAIRSGHRIGIVVPAERSARPWRAASAPLILP